jgi:hypothetical protein
MQEVEGNGIPFAAVIALVDTATMQRLADRAIAHVTSLATGYRSTPIETTAVSIHAPSATPLAPVTTTSRPSNASALRGPVRHPRDAHETNTLTTSATRPTWPFGDIAAPEHAADARHRSPYPLETTMNGMENAVKVPLI